MKKTVLTFGLISGVISSLMMLGTLPFMHKIGYDKGLIVGYTGIVLSFLLVFFGIRSYRENVGNGSITFGRAFSVGILITLISCAFYVVTWEIIYFKLMPDFMQTFTNYAVEQVRASGGSQQMIDAKLKEMKDLGVMLNNPLLNAAFTFIEPFPVGLLLTLISAAILRKKHRPADDDARITDSALTTS
jgi:hypothetical protein